MIAFDVYGTLIDTRGVEQLLEGFMGERAERFSNLWRAKQLEYSFRRGLMRLYEPFDVCTAQALDFACEALGEDLDTDQREVLLAQYRELPAFPDVAPALADLRRRGHRLAAFSNGRLASIEELLQSAGVRDAFDLVHSVEGSESFKPNPDVYEELARSAECKPQEVWLVSGNSFDVIGALAAGLRGVWVRRSSDAVFDPWGLRPTLVVASLAELGPSIRLT